MKEQLRNIFQNNYPGIDIFISDVLTPIFSEDYIENKNVNLIDSEEIQRRANNANIKLAYHVADIERIDSDPIAVYDVTLNSNSKITHSRVAIKQFITALSMTYTHIFIVFHYENEPDRPWRFSYVYKEGTTTGTRDTAKRYTYVFGKDYRCRTAVDRFALLAKSAKSDSDFAKAFSVETLSDEFFDNYRELYADFVQFITGKRYEKDGNRWVERTKYEPNVQYNTTFDCDDKLVRDYIKKMFGRIVFLYFLQRKGWLAKNKQYMHDLYYNSEHKDNFLDEVLEPLFFEVLNTDIKYRNTEAKKLPDSDDIPYLNGGLFARDEIDELQCIFPKEYFKQLFDFLDSYNFTIDENDPEDAEVGIDPEMLGRIFESLLEDNKDKGAYYTPKEIVQYMCQESLISYLETNTNIAKDKIRQFVLNPYECVVGLTVKHQSILQKALENVKICDPAIGSGAFPMGLLNELLKCRVALCGVDCNRTEIKKSIIQNNIYGVDIEKGAVDIARLRFWLSIVVDEEGTPSPLPNLNYKIMQGNSLIESFMGIDLSKLTYKKEGKKDTGELTLFDEDKVKLQKYVLARLREYYSCSDHDSKINLQQQISDSINALLEVQFNDSEKLEQLREINLVGNDKFFLWHTWFSDVFEEKGGFDIVIGNPPYGVSIKNDYRATVVAELGNVPDYEIYYYFIECAKRLLITKGTLSFIIPNTWLFNTYASNYRNALFSDWELVEVLDCSKFKIFKSATVRNTIITWKRDLSKNSINIGYRNTAQALSFSALIKEPRLNLTITELLQLNKNWGIAFSRSKEVIKLIYKIKNEKQQVVEVFPNVSQGLIAYDKYKGQTAEVIEKRAYHSFTYIPGLKKWLYGEDVRRYVVDWNEKEYIDYCDGIANPRQPKYFTEKRLLIREITNPSIYAAITSEELYNDPSVIIVLDSRQNYPIEVVLAVLNSKLATFYHFNHSPKATKGLFPKILVVDVKEFPLPKFDEEKFKQIEQYTNKLMTIYKEKSLENTCNIENKIDLLVYKLYNLSYEEVLIIDPETPITKEEYENYSIVNE